MSKEKKTVIITGGNTGLGYECAKVIAKANNDWHIILASRNKERVNTAAQELIQTTGNQHISGMVVDLASFSSIHHFVHQFNEADLPPLHSIICNAGVQFVQGTQATVDGIEATFGVNHLGHFLLVRLLLNQIQDRGSIVVVSSDTHDPLMKTGMPAPIYLHPSIMANPQKSDESLANLSSLNRGQTRYTTSKLCNLYFSYELARRIEKANRLITVKAFNPGMMPGRGSSLSRDYNPILKFMWNNVLPLMRFFRSSIRTTQQSGTDLANLILNQRFSSSGQYFDGPKKIASSKESYDIDRAKELWSWSSDILGLNENI
ncbi:SDR family NAD(P)-dependent oxidoreductase [Gracilibacillus thailandensis]|uniref:SDR family NAD(P)-dependent oxidoreductase n=1 Tax=Gracilibacillus thailandensis TaxID=563735 RepID=A0A6N7QRT5_9BACI|nr:SDR family NAD(P)-dependent oxidoreductase [Gracilibacillus thailandensis]MRI64807.1 SDR family NAD(P)-dependent oxidoreductase [Gracilibacillus thailandensis]